MEDAMATMQAQMAAMQVELARTAEENRQLRQTQLAQSAQQSEALSTLPALIEQLRLAHSRAPERSLVDTRGIGKPQVFRDESPASPSGGRTPRAILSLRSLAYGNR